MKWEPSTVAVKSLSQKAQLIIQFTFIAIFSIFREEKQT